LTLLKNLQLRMPKNEITPVTNIEPVSGLGDPGIASGARNHACISVRLETPLICDVSATLPVT
jgi:hypothetical protein